jgi:hypothetical protein
MPYRCSKVGGLKEGGMTIRKGDLRDKEFKNVILKRKIK